MKNRIVKVIVATLIVSICIAALFLPQLSSGSQTSRQLELGNKYLQNNQYEEAILIFQKVILIDSKNSAAYFGLAKAYRLSGNLHLEEDALRTILQLDSGNVEAYILLSDILINRNELEAAVELLKKGFELTLSELISSRILAYETQIAEDSGEQRKSPQMMRWENDLAFIPVTKDAMDSFYTISSDVIVQAFPDTVYFNITKRSGNLDNTILLEAMESDYRRLTFFDSMFQKDENGKSIRFGDENDLKNFNIIQCYLFNKEKDIIAYSFFNMTDGISEKEVAFSTSIPFDCAKLREEAELLIQKRTSKAVRLNPAVVDLKSKYEAGNGGAYYALNVDILPESVKLATRSGIGYGGNYDEDNVVSTLRWYALYIDPIDRARQFRYISNVNAPYVWLNDHPNNILLLIDDDANILGYAVVNTE